MRHNLSNRRVYFGFISTCSFLLFWQDDRVGFLSKYAIKLVET